MSFKEYEVVDDPESRAGKQLGQIANIYQMKASKMLTAVDDFIDDDGASGERMAVGSGHPPEEVYLVPPGYVLAHIPDAAILIRVDHAAKRIEFVEIYDQCGGPGFNWNAIRTRAVATLRYP